MFFLQQCNYKQYLDKQFLTHFRSVLENSFLRYADTPLVLLKKITSKNVVRRMSLLSLPAKSFREVRASITLEAALVLPIFIFFVINMFSVMEMLRLYGNISFSLNSVGGKLSLYGYAYEQVETLPDMGTIGDVAFTYWYVKDEITEMLGEEYLENSPLVNGKESLGFLKARIMEDDLVELVVAYEMEVPFCFGESKMVRTHNSYRGRVWTGYDVSSETEESVYITENGEVYHLYADCSYIKLSLQRVESTSIDELENREGKSYTMCELCPAQMGGIVWITENGERYHTSETCQGIKRTIYKMSAETARQKGYELCSRCGER